jgi:Heterokaryon incompatibility protein (HET)
MTQGLPILNKYIWIDGICINQQDLAEHSSQIALMGEVYKRAGIVIACFGEKDIYTERALRLITRLSESPTGNIRQQNLLALVNPPSKFF